MTTDRAPTIRQMAEQAVERFAGRPCDCGQRRACGVCVHWTTLLVEFGQAVAVMVEREYEHNISVAESLRRVMQETREQCRPYMRHKPDCHIATDGNGEYINCYRPLGGCDCGLEAAIRASEDGRT